MTFSLQRLSDNLHLLEQFNPILAKQLACLSQDLHSFSICQTNQELNLIGKEKEEPYYLHSPDSPSQEAILWFKDLSLDQVEVLYLYGIGLGYSYDCLLPWLKENEKRQLVILEDHLSVLWFLFQTRRGELMLKDFQVNFYFIDSKKESFSDLFKIVQDYPLRSYLISSLPSYEKLFSSFYSYLVTRLHFETAEQAIRNKEITQFGSPFFNNFYQNLQQLTEAYQGQRLYGAFQNVPAIICGAGPSLTKSIPILKELQDRALLFGPGSSMNILNTHHIWPHFGVNIDPTPETYHRQIMNRAFETPVFYTNRIYPEALSAIHGPHIYLPIMSFYPITQWFDQQLGLEPAVIKAGYNVVNLCLEIAFHLGCNPIILLGMDLCFKPGEHYASGVEQHPLFPSYPPSTFRGEAFPVKDRLGQTVMTYWPWIMEAHWIDTFYHDHSSIRLIDATEGGIGLFSVPTISLKEIKDTELQSSYDLPALIHYHLQKAGKLAITTQQIQTSIETFYTSLRRCETDCHELIAATFALKTLDTPLDESQLMKEEAFQYCLKPFNEFFLHLTAVEKRTIQRLSNPKTKLKLYKKISEERYYFLLQTISIQTLIIQDVLNEKGKQPFLFSSPSLPKLDVQQQPSNLSSFYYSSGALYSIQHDKTSLKDGRELYYYENGDLKSDIYYVKGKLEGPVRLYYPGGRLKRELFFKEGLRDGIEKMWYPNGQLFTEVEYTNNEPKKARCWTAEGLLVKEILR